MPATVSNFDCALAAANEPSSWHCAECGSTADCWISLEDGTIWCEDAAHASAYAKRVGVAPLFIQIGAPQVVKNLCTGGTVKLGARKSDDVKVVSAIATIRSRLRAMQTLGGEKWAKARKWDKVRLAVKLFGVPFLTRASQLHRKKLDMQATALRRWMHLDMWRLFQRWKRSSATPTQQTANVAVGTKRPRHELDLSSFQRPAAPKTKLEIEARQGRTGLRNLGNTCYMNSTIQALVHMPLFRAFIFSLQAPTQVKVMDMLSSLTDTDAHGLPVSPDGAPARPQLRRLNSGLADVLEFGPTLSQFPASSQSTEEVAMSSVDGRRTRARIAATDEGKQVSLQARTLTKALHEVASRIFGFEPVAVYTPDAFLKTMWVSLPAFSGFNQHDAEEFARAFLSRLDDEDSAFAASNGDKGGSFRDMFSGTTQVSITCSKCKNVSSRTESFFGPYTVDIPEKLRCTDARKAPVCTLYECFQEALKPVKLSGDCAYSCERCQKKVDATMCTTFTKIPPLFLIHINRVSWLHSGSKIFTAVTVPESTIELGEWATDGVPAAATMYELHSVVRHMGSGFKQGHYMAYARNDVEAPWYCYNDARISQIEEDEFESIQGYVYYFQRKHALL